MSGNYRDLTGEKFNRLTVLHREGSHGSRACWKCRCDCGNEVIVETADLKSGNTKSCGCFRKEIIAERSLKHGEAGNRLYHVWVGIKKRCYDSNSTSYEYYGGRGIRVCDEWRHDYESFRDWAIKNGYNNNATRGECTIDRIKVNENYSPQNCRWVSMKEQAMNKRCSHG